MLVFEANDYVVIQADKKKALALVSKVKKGGKSFIAVLESDRTKDTIPQKEYKTEDVIAVLGPDPKVGSVFGCSTERYRNTRTVDGWGTGEIGIFRQMDKKELKLLRNGVRNAVAKIEELGLESFPFRTEVREAKGRWAGYYKFNPKAEDFGSPQYDEALTDLIVLKPKDFDNLDLLLYHEYAHSLWYRRISTKTRARWIILYHKAIELATVKPQEIEALAENFNSSGMDCKAFSRSLEDREKLIFKECLIYVNAHHNLSNDNLNTLIAAGKPVSDYFNVGTIKLQDMQLVLTEYAQVSPEEFFAEAISYHLGNMKLPKRLTKIVSKTLDEAANYSED